MLASVEVVASVWPYEITGSNVCLITHIYIIHGITTALQILSILIIPAAMYAPFVDSAL